MGCFVQDEDSKDKYQTGEKKHIRVYEKKTDEFRYTFKGHQLETAGETKIRMERGGTTKQSFHPLLA